MELHVRLKYGCGADVVTDDTDRQAYVPPPLAPEDHDADRCGCGACRLARELGPLPGMRPVR
jgi:hypothetical protein